MESKVNYWYSYYIEVTTSDTKFLTISDLPKNIRESVTGAFFKNGGLVCTEYFDNSPEDCYKSYKRLVVCKWDREDGYNLWINDASDYIKYRDQHNLNNNIKQAWISRIPAHF